MQIRGKVVEPKECICWFDIFLLLKCVQEEKVGSNLGWFKRTYFIDTPLEQKGTMGVTLLPAVDRQII